MSHPIPGHDYGENHKPKINSLQRAMGKFLEEAGSNLRGNNENHLDYLKRMSKNDALKKKAGGSKKKKIYGPKKAEKNWFERNAEDQGTPSLPPGYRQSELE